MKPIRYTDAVPPMPDHFKNAMLDTLEGLESMKRTHKFSASLAVALAAMLALTGIAFAAAQYGLLDFIFTDVKPGNGAEQVIRHVEVTDQGQYADFTVHDYILSGSDLYVDWTLQMHTDERLVLISTGMDTDFARDYFDDQAIPDSLAVNNPFTDTFPGGTWTSMNRGYFYEGAHAEPFDVTMDLAFVRPNPEVAMASFTEECSYRNQPVWQYDDESVSWSYGYYSSETDSGTDDEKVNAKLDARAAEVGYHQAWLKFFEEYGYGEVVEQLSVTFTVVPGNTPIMRLSEPKTFELRDYTVTVNDVEFNGFNADMNLTIELPEENDDFMPRFTVLADGEPVKLAAQMDSSQTSFVYNYDLWSEGGCTQLPTELTLVANDSEEEIVVKLSEE